ncbi:hypothetical protein IDH19_00755 [Pelagibacterales bacterium SAG-MED48]|nr:hypothetical protein [Pelagibacterales bacterium SAG-MED48]
MEKLKIGLLIDDLNLDNFNSEIVSTIKKNDSYKISLIIINKKISKKKKIISIFKKYSILRIFEKMMIKFIFLFEEKIINNFFEKYEFTKIDLNKIDCDKINVNQIISNNGFFYEYSDKDLKIINNHKLDVIIRMGAGILKGKILEINKYGVISYHHGDNNFFRGGPPGFWEVYFKKPSTGFVIQRLNNNLDGGEILFKGSMPTKHFYFQNQSFIFKQSAKYISNVLERIHTKQERIIDNKIYYNRIFKDPNLIQIANYIIKIYSLIFFKFMRKIFLKKDNWNIAFKKGKFNEFRLEQFKIINSDKGFLADPFLFKKNNINYIFAEEYSYKKKRGVISCFKLTENKAVSLGTVLEESFHLSFPYIFKFENEILMCPETFEKKEIRLYKCVEFPKKWEFKKTLLKNISATDTLIFYKNDLWWMLTNADQNEIDYTSELSIFYSKDGPLTDNWISHKLNPIYVNPLKARNGGIIYDDRNIYRVNQKIGFNQYGKSFGINRILNIDENSYEEETFSNVKPNFFKNIHGTHHMNNNEDYTVFDFFKRKYLF